MQTVRSNYVPNKKTKHTNRSKIPETIVEESEEDTEEDDSKELTPPEEKKKDLRKPEHYKNNPDYYESDASSDASKSDDSKEDDSKESDRELTPEEKKKELRRQKNREHYKNNPNYYKEKNQKSRMRRENQLKELEALRTKERNMLTELADQISRLAQTQRVSDPLYHQLNDVRVYLGQDVIGLCGLGSDSESEKTKKKRKHNKQDKPVGTFVDEAACEAAQAIFMAKMKSKEDKMEEEEKRKGDKYTPVLVSPQEEKKNKKHKK